MSCYLSRSHDAGYIVAPPLEVLGSFTKPHKAEWSGPEPLPGNSGQPREGLALCKVSLLESQVTWLVILSDIRAAIQPKSAEALLRLPLKPLVSRVLSNFHIPQEQFQTLSSYPGVVWGQVCVYLGLCVHVHLCVCLYVCVHVYVYTLGSVHSPHAPVYLCICV